MLLGRIIGTVWATRKDHSVTDMKFLVVQGMNLDGSARKDFVVAVDAVGAGMGETVLVAQGSSGRQTEITKDRPVDAVIMAIVDDLEVIKKRSWKAFDRRDVGDLVSG
jgi:microcompartment protein CcmK/EutM